MEHRRIPNRLKKYRRLAGLTQLQVARVLNLQNTSCISRWEKGLAFPNTLNVFRLSILYKTAPTHLYSELWESIKTEVLQCEQNLLAHYEPFIHNETYLL